MQPCCSSLFCVFCFVCSLNCSLFFSPDHLNLFTRVPGAIFRDDNKYNKLINNTTAGECAHACIMTPGFGCNSFAYSSHKTVCGLSDDVISSTNDVRKVDSYDSFQYSGGKQYFRFMGPLVYCYIVSKNCLIHKTYFCNWF